MERRKINPWRWSEERGYDQAIEVSGAGRMLFCSGQSSVDADGNPLHAGDMLAQAIQSLENLGTVLEAAGYGPADVVRLNVYVTDIDGWWAVAEDLASQPEVQAWPTSSGTVLAVSRLAMPELLIEVEATAVR